jgi:hypothetical protein
MLCAPTYGDQLQKNFAPCAKTLDLMRIFCAYLWPEFIIDDLTFLSGLG